MNRLVGNNKAVVVSAGIKAIPKIWRILFPQDHLQSFWPFIFKLEFFKFYLEGPTTLQRSARQRNSAG